MPHLTRHLASIAYAIGPQVGVAVGRRLDVHWRTEVGFFEQVAFKPNGIDVERNHTLTVSLG